MLLSKHRLEIIGFALTSPVGYDGRSFSGNGSLYQKGATRLAGGRFRDGGQLHTAD
jgi:hypothetical protein